MSELDISPNCKECEHSGTRDCRAENCPEERKVYTFKQLRVAMVAVGCPVILIDKVFEELVR